MGLRKRAYIADRAHRCLNLYVSAVRDTIHEFHRQDVNLVDSNLDASNSEVALAI